MSKVSVIGAGIVGASVGPSTLRNQPGTLTWRRTGQERIARGGDREKPTGGKGDFA